MKVISNINASKFLVKGFEYEVESENETNYIINGIGWLKKDFTIVNESNNEESDNGIAIEFNPCIEMNREKLIDLIGFAVGRFGVLSEDACDSILNDWMSKND